MNRGRPLISLIALLLLLPALLRADQEEIVLESDFGVKI